MDQLRCRRCSREVHPGRGDYYLVRIDAVADPEPPVITEEELAEDVRAEIEGLIRRAAAWSERELEHQVYRCKVIYLCTRCFRHWIEDPVGPDDRPPGP